MKNYFIFLLILLLNIELQAQMETSTVIGAEKSLKNYEVIFGMVRNPSEINRWVTPTEINPPLNPHFNILQSGSSDYKDVFKYSLIAIRVYSIEDSSLVKLGDVGLKNVKLYVGNLSPIIIPISNDNLKIHDKYIDVKKLLEELDENGNNKYVFNHNDRVRIELEFNQNDMNIITIPPFNGTFKNTTSPYSGLNSNTGGFWIPVFLFSSNLKSGENGIPFAAMPIGVAWGWKKFNSKGKYKGVSVMGNWLIYSEGEENEDFTTSTNFSVSNISIGTIIDLNDVIYLGYAYGFDFRTNISDPGHMFVLGFGSGAIRYLKSNKNNK
jgi:hypothetical protein